MNRTATTFPVLISMRHRAGNALVATLIISVTVGLALNLSSDRLQGLEKVSRLDEGRQQARLAAESIGTVIEGKLQLKFGGDSNTFTKKLEEYQPGWALGFPGYAGASGADTEGLWFGKCLVRWRIEPVKVWSQTIAKESDTPAGAEYALNPNSDISNLENDSKYKDLVANDEAFLGQNENNYMYRIVTDAYYMGSNTNKSAKPWLPGSVDKAICRAQAVRVVQYTLTSLFEYTIFYAATGPIGDLEFWQGTGMAVKGRVHSNGAIYIGGGGTGQNSGQYHAAASGNGGLAIGGAAAADQSTVTAVDGIYRMRKPVNYVATSNGVSGASFTPENISKVSNGSTTDLNGDTPSDTRHTINGVAFTSANDSRSSDRLMKDFNKRVRDKWTGASIVTSLANAPDFGGFPFEAQRIGSSNQFLYADSGQAAPGFGAMGSAPGSPIVVSLDRDHPAFGGRGAIFYYQVDPVTANGPVATTFDPAQSFNPARPLDAAVRATNLPLYIQVPGEETVDVNIPAGAVTTPYGFSSAEAQGPLLARNLTLDDNRTGLVVRERPSQLAPNPEHPGALPDTPSASQLQAMRDYLRSQYVVLFNNQDITADFFGDLTRTTPIAHLPVCTRAADAIATEDMIINRREANFMQTFFGNHSSLNWSATNFTGPNTFNPSTGLGVNRQYRVNVLTLNLRRVQDFLARMRFKDIISVPAWSGDDRYLKSGFNGVIYAHRTRRSQTYHPLDRPHLVFRPNVNVPAATLTPQNNYAAPGRPSTIGIPSPHPTMEYPHRIREGHGPVETFHCAVRIRGGLVSDGSERALRSAVNWAHDSNDDGVMDPSPLGTSKTTIISPNPLYLWGDLNTVSYSDGQKPQRTPVAVFGDAANLLSAAWRDANVPLYTSGIPSATHTSYVTSMVINNIPCFEWNARAEGTGAVANLCRFLENWGGNNNPWPNPLGMPRPPNYGGQVVYTFMGSLVVMNQQRYSRGLLGAGAAAPLNDVSFYSPPFRNLGYNSDLKLKDGLPPEAPNGVEPIRVVSTVNIFDY
jgi:hypothetical protein